MDKIIFENVSFTYDKEKYIFKNLNFELPTNGFIVFLGKSGSGKSTFLSLISNKLQPTEGTIKGIEKTIGIVFQSPILLDYLSVYENVSLPLVLDGISKDIIETKVNDVLKLVHLEDFLNKDVTKMSGGEKMRISIARALVTNSNTIILDEPTGQLDDKNSIEIYNLLKDLSKDHLILLVTHDEKNGTSLADKIYRLKEGSFILEKDNSIENKEEDKKFKEIETINSINIDDSLSLSKSYLKKHRFRVLISTFFLAFSLVILYLGLNLSFNITNSMNDLLSYYYNNDVASISLKEDVADAGKLKLTKYTCPDKNTLHNFDIENSYPSLDYFLPQYNEVTLKRSNFDIRFEPVILENKNKLSLGTGFKDKQDIVVNELFVKTFELNENEILNKKLYIQHSTLVYTNIFKETDMVNLDFKFTIKGVSKEQSVFNEPIIYYNYFGIYDYLDSICLTNISQSLVKSTSIIDLLKDEKYIENDITSQKRLILNNDLESLKISLNSKYSNKFKLESKSLTIKENITNIVSSLTKIGLIFLLICLISAFMLEFISIYSLYDENIKLFALVKTFSKSNSNIIKIGFSNGIYFFLITAVIFLFISLISTFVINKILVINSFPKFLLLVDFKSFLIVLFVSFFISIPASIFPLRKIKDSKIKREIEGED